MTQGIDASKISHYLTNAAGVLVRNAHGKTRQSIIRTLQAPAELRMSVEQAKSSHLGIIGLETLAGDQIGFLDRRMTGIILAHCAGKRQCYAWRNGRKEPFP